MLKTYQPQKVKFFTGLIYQDYQQMLKTKKMLVKSFGEIDLTSDTFPFNFTDYYCQEMGSPLFRTFFSFRKLKDSGSFSKIKKHTIKIEKKLSKNNQRSVNIDPGYLNLAKLVLTTTKDYAHRIYIGRGIFAEVTLIYRGGNFQELPWTYPDFKSISYKKFFCNLRKKYQQQLK
jgi:hypothetical protein